MRNLVLLAIVAIFLLSGFRFQEVPYQVNMDLAPTPRSSVFDVALGIQKTLESGESRLIANPRLRVLLDQPAEIALNAENSHLMVKVTTTQKEDRILATANVRLLKAGQVTFEQEVKSSLLLQ